MTITKIPLQVFSIRSLIGTIVFLAAFSAPLKLQAQTPTPLWRLASGSFGRARDNAVTLDRTDLNNSLFIRLMYSSFGQDDAVLVVTFRNQDNTFHQSYPVEIFSYKDRNKKVEIYGPQYYQGQDQLSVSFDLVLLKKDTMQRYKDKFDSFFKPAATFIPVIAQASGYIEKAWDAMKGVIPDTKAEPLGAIPIIRMTDQDFPSTENRWFLLGNPTALASASSLTAFPATAEDSLLPRLPDTFTGGKNRLLTVSVTKAGIPPSFAALAKRQSELLGDTDQQRLGKLGIKIINPYDADRTKEDLAMNRIFSGFLALAELSNVRPSLTTEFAVRWVFNEFKQGQDQSDGGSIIALGTENDARVSHALASFFAYEGLPSTSKEKGLPSIAAWKQWLDKRNAAKSIEWFPAKADANDPNRKTGVAPYGRATTKYADAFIALNKPSATDNQASAKERIQAMSRDISKLKKLLSVFRPTENEPWLLYEQQYTAQWIRDHLTGIADLPTKPVFDSDQDVKAFADAFEKQLTTSKVLKSSGDSSDKWKFVPVSKYVSDAFTATLPAVAASTDPNKQAVLLGTYLLLVDPVITDPEIPSAKDLADLGDFLNRIFPPDTLTKKNFTDIGFNDYFKNNIVSVEMLGTRPIIKRPQRADEALSKMKYAEALFSSDLRATGAAATDLKLKRLDALRQVGQILNNSTLNLSIRQKALEFLRGYVPALIDATTPSPAVNTAYVDLWSAKLMGTEGLVTKSKLTWSDDLPGFVETGSTDDLSETISIRAIYDEIKDKPEVEPTGGKNATVEPLIEIACGNSNSVAQRDAAFKLLQLMVELPSAVPAADRNSCPHYQLFRSQSYSWVNGKYRWDPTPSSAPSPTP